MLNWGKEGYNIIHTKRTVALFLAWVILIENFKQVTSFLW